MTWVGLLLAAEVLASEPPGVGRPTADRVPSPAPSEPARIQDVPLWAERPTYVHVLGTLVLGAGLRFNNPYRLSRVLGSDAESVSSTAPYVGLGLGATFGDPFGWQTGPMLRWDHALSGVGQEVLTPSWIAVCRWRTLGVQGRVGVPVLLSPDVTAGGELGLAMTYYVRAGLGAHGEVIGSLFSGAATPENAHPWYPVLSAHLGLQVDWERLP